MGTSGFGLAALHRKDNTKTAPQHTAAGETESAPEKLGCCKTFELSSIISAPVLERGTVPAPSPSMTRDIKSNWFEVSFWGTIPASNRMIPKALACFPAADSGWKCAAGHQTAGRRRTSRPRTDEIKAWCLTLMWSLPGSSRSRSRVSWNKKNLWLRSHFLTSMVLVSFSLNRTVRDNDNESGSVLKPFHHHL